MKSLSLHGGNVVLFCLAGWLMLWVHPERFMNEHEGTFFVLFFTFALAFVYSFYRFLDEEGLKGLPGVFYLAMMNSLMFLHKGVEEQKISALWMVMLGCIGASVYLYFFIQNYLKKENVQEEKTKTKTVSLVKNAPYFHHPDFDFVLENLEQDILFLQSHSSIIGVEHLHNAEKMLEDLKKAADHYTNMRSEHRHEAEEYIETLCIFAEEFTEECKRKIDTSHRMQIEKLSMKQRR